MKIYIAGPMSGMADFNRPAFFAAASEIAASGDIPLNPAVLPDGLSEANYMLIALTLLQCADAIYLLDGWLSSAGARAEYALAEKLRLKVQFQTIKSKDCSAFSYGETLF